MLAVRATHHAGFQIVAAPPKATPRKGEILIKNIFVASNPKDWKLSTWGFFDGIEGSDTAGYIEAIGNDVKNFKIGDRVIACTPSATSDKNGTYQSFSIAPQHLVAGISQKLAFNEAVTIPLCFSTAVVAIHGVLGINEEQSHVVAAESTPSFRGVDKILINGGGSAIGFYAAQLATLAGLEVHVIVRTVFSKDKVKSAGIQNVFLVEADDDLDVDTNIQETEYSYAFDAVSTPSTVEWMMKKLSASSSSSSSSSSKQPCKFSVLAGGVMEDITAIAQKVAPSHVQVLTTNFGATGQAPYSEFANLVQRWLAKVDSLLLKGDLHKQPFTEARGGITSIPKGLATLRDGKASSHKLIYRLAEG